MSLQFILGGAGSGKSYVLNHQIVREAAGHPEETYILIVPEQFTMETQKALVDAHPGHSILNIDIVSFERLAFRVFEELSCAPQTILDDTGKSMLLRKACAGIEKKLEIYGRHLNRPGFIEELKSMMSEFGQYRIGEEELERLEEQTKSRPLLHSKLKDLRLLFGAFRAAMGEGMITAEELLPVLCRVLPRSRKIRGSVIALDGFTGFTPAQYEVLELLLRYGKRMIVSVTVDPGAEPYREGRSSDLFALSRKTIAALERLAGEARTDREQDICLSPERPPRFARSGELAFLSEQLLRRSGRSWEEEPRDIHLYAEENPETECLALVQKIAWLVREKHYRYRDVAVVCGDLEGYRPVLEQAMDEAGIPCFLDDKRSLLTNPLVEYMRAALEIVEKDFPYESMFRYLKSGFSDIPEDVLFEMENYVLALGIRGHRRWSEPWERVYRGGEHVNLKLLNEAREKIAAPLLALRDVFRTKGVTVRQMTEALFHWMDGQNAEETLRQMAKQFQEAGEYSLAKEYDQAYGQLLELFDRIVGLLGDEVMSVKTYHDVLDAGCREIRVGVIPAALDRVSVGDMERSRFGAVRALFFIGVNDGNVPRPGRQGGLLSEMDREELKPYVSLTPTRQESSLIDQFYFYLTVTKPSDALYISYSMSDEMGEGKSPSSYLSSLYRIFPALQPVTGEQTVKEEGAVSVRMALRLLAEGMDEYREGRESEAWRRLYGCLYEKEENRAVLRRMADMAFAVYGGDCISRAAARALYGEPLKGSVTRLERYAVCAYAQFLSYGLELTRRKEFEFAALDMGNVFHKGLELCFRKAEESGISLADLDEGKRKGLVEDAMAQAAESLGNNVLKSSARNEYLFHRMGRIMEKTVWALGEQLKAGRFEPVAFELTFSPGENEAMRISLAGEGQMQLKGKIDRVDLYEDEDHVYVKIIDYKSGGMDFDLTGVYYGLQLQLVVYLDAVMRREQRKHPDKEIVPAGMFYYQIQDPILERDAAGSDPEDAVLSALRPKGIFNGEDQVTALFQKETPRDGASRWIPAVMKDGKPVRGKSSQASREQFAHMRNFVIRRMQEFGTAIARGDISARPYKRKDQTGCDYCEFRSVCGFDRKLPGYEYRRLKEPSPEEIWTEMARTDQPETLRKAGERNGSGVDGRTEKDH